MSITKIGLINYYYSMKKARKILMILDKEK